jgi:hypothetical protein
MRDLNDQTQYWNEIGPTKQLPYSVKLAKDSPRRNGWTGHDLILTFITIASPGRNLHPNQPEPFSDDSDSCIWPLQCWEMTTPVKHDQARPGNTGGHLIAVLHAREAILPPPNQKRRTDNARKISPAVRPAEARRVLPQEYRRACPPRHPTEATHCVRRVGSGLVGNGCSEFLDDGVELPPLYPIVTSARSHRFTSRARIASH